uniref:Uncharacterized protein n=1 Tax=Sphaerodactylus townsendi TaxID=933632 RepID=A0ACB8EJD1_9SAUR
MRRGLLAHSIEQLNSCITAENLCLADPVCNATYRILGTCSHSYAKNSFFTLDHGAWNKCLQAETVIRNSHFQECKCQRRTQKQEEHCLRIYWTVHSTVSKGDFNLEMSPYKNVVSEESLKMDYNKLASQVPESHLVGDTTNPCLQVAQVCSLNRRCRRLRSTYVSNCSPKDGHACNQRKCHRELRHFFGKVDMDFTKRFLFCSCQDEFCGERRRKTIVPDCSFQGSTQPNCLVLLDTCLKDYICKSRLADFQEQCKPSSSSPDGCFQHKHAACLEAYMGMIETLNRNTERTNEINSILTEWNCLKTLIEGMASHQRPHKNSDVIPPTKQVVEIIRQPQIDPAPHSQLLDLSIHQQPIQYQTINRENLKSPLKPLNQEIDIDLRSERVLNYRDFRSLGGKSWAAELEELQLCSIDPSPGTTSDTITHNGTDETLICISSKVPPIEHESTINEGKNTEGFRDLSIGLQEDPVDISASSAPALGQRNFIKSTAQVHHYDIIPNNGSTSQNTGTISRVPISVTHPDMNSIVNRISSNGCVQYPQSQITPLDGTPMTPNYIRNSTADVTLWCSCENSGNHKDVCDEIRSSFSNNRCLRNAMQSQMGLNQLNRKNQEELHFIPSPDIQGDGTSTVLTANLHWESAKKIPQEVDIQNEQLRSHSAYSGGQLSLLTLTLMLLLLLLGSP